MNCAAASSYRPGMRRRAIISKRGMGRRITCVIFRIQTRSINSKWRRFVNKVIISNPLLRFNSKPLVNLKIVHWLQKSLGFWGWSIKISAPSLRKLFTVNEFLLFFLRTSKHCSVYRVLIIFNTTSLNCRESNILFVRSGSSMSATASTSEIIIELNDECPEIKWLGW